MTHVTPCLHICQQRFAHIMHRRRRQHILHICIVFLFKSYQDLPVLVSVISSIFGFAMVSG